MIDGQAIREARLAMNLTQAQLAEGITNRCLVGKIENNKDSPHGKTLRALLARLNINYNDVYFDNNQTELKKFDVIALEGHYKLTQSDLKKIMPHIEREHDLLHAQFLLSYCYLHRHHNYEKSLLDFQQLVEIEGNNPQDIFSVIAREQQSRINVKLGNYGQAKDLITETITLLPKIQRHPNVNWTAFLYYDLSVYYQSCNDYQLSNEYAKKALELLKKHNSNILVDSISFLIAQNAADINGWQNERARNYLIQAWTFATFTFNSTHAKFFKEILDKHKIVVN